MFKDEVVYQIYPKSFNDSNNDGKGDLRGIINRLDYLDYLGVDCIWLTPIFKSPQNDNGYDVSDYYQLDETYGTMDDLTELIEKANKLNIKIMFDMVFNHTSTEHEWFKKALEGDPKYIDYYYFKKGKGSNPPTNWESKFGGSCWEYVEKLDKYYLHLFDVTQADLNWENPEVRNELKKVVLFWMNKGVKGFRFDVINLISKPEIWEDDYDGDGRKYYTDGRHVHEFIRELNEATFGKDVEIISVGEMSSTTIDNCIKYSNPENHELNMTFNFHHLKVDYLNNDKWQLKPFDFKELKRLFFIWQIEMQEHNGWNALFLNNHDQPRALSRFADDDKYRYESATMLACSIQMLRGTPYIYQGEELGMTNAYFADICRYRDVESLNYYKILEDKGLDENKIIEILQARSRDNSRTPMQWNNNKNAGFSNGDECWIDVNDNYQTINVAQDLKNGKSIIEFYRKLIKLRHSNKIVSDGLFEPLFEDHEQIFGYKRLYENKEWVILCNYSNKIINLESFDNDYQIILSNYEENDLNHLKPYQCLILERK